MKGAAALPAVLPLLARVRRLSIRIIAEAHEADASGGRKSAKEGLSKFRRVRERTFVTQVLCLFQDTHTAPLD